MHSGSCLCGTVRYEIRGDLGAAFFCHCSLCRKASGSAFAANVLVEGEDFVVVAGAEAIGRHRSSATLVREFCTRCGSPLVSRRDGISQVRVRMGTLDQRAAFLLLGLVVAAALMRRRNPFAFLASIGVVTALAWALHYAAPPHTMVSAPDFSSAFLALDIRGALKLALAPASTSL